MKLYALFASTLMVANAAIITNYIDNGTATASLQYRFFVNNGGNSNNRAFLNGSDPASLSHAATNPTIADGLLVDDVELDLTLTHVAISSSRVAAYFSGVSQTYNPLFQATHNPQYTITVSSSAGSNSYVGTGSTSDLDVLSLLNFTALLDVSATNRQIAVSWQDTVDFLLPAAMPNGALPGSNNPSREYRWNVSSGLSGLTDLRLTLSEVEPPPPPSSVPEPGTVFLLGSSLLALGTFGIRRKASK